MQTPCYIPEKNDLEIFFKKNKFFFKKFFFSKKIFALKFNKIIKKMIDEIRCFDSGDDDILQVEYERWLHDWEYRTLENVLDIIKSLPDIDEWISADNPPEEVQMKQILAYEIDERRWIITATFYDGNWLRDDNENICYFDFWKELPTPPIN